MPRMSIERWMQRSRLYWPRRGPDGDRSLPPLLPSDRRPRGDRPHRCDDERMELARARPDQIDVMRRLLLTEPAYAALDQRCDLREALTIANDLDQLVVVKYGRRPFAFFAFATLSWASAIRFCGPPCANSIPTPDEWDSGRNVFYVPILWGLKNTVLYLDIYNSFFPYKAGDRKPLGPLLAQKIDGNKLGLEMFLGYPDLDTDGIRYVGNFLQILEPGREYELTEQNLRHKLATTVPMELTGERNTLSGLYGLWEKLELYPVYKDFVAKRPRADDERGAMAWLASVFAGPPAPVGYSGFDWLDAARQEAALRHEPFLACLDAWRIGRIDEESFLFNLLVYRREWPDLCVYHVKIVLALARMFRDQPELWAFPPSYLQRRHRWAYHARFTKRAYNGRGLPFGHWRLGGDESGRGNPFFATDWLTRLDYQVLYIKRCYVREMVRRFENQPSVSTVRYKQLWNFWDAKALKAARLTHSAMYAKQPTITGANSSDQDDDGPLHPPSPA